MIRAGKLNAYRPGATPTAKIFFDEAELDAFIEAQKYQPAPQAEDRQRDNKGRYQLGPRPKARRPPGSPDQTALALRYRVAAANACSGAGYTVEELESGILKESKESLQVEMSLRKAYGREIDELRSSDQ